MYTECPKCQSVFMVSEEDISAHEGLVRCGNCYSVFNAGANLTDDPQGSEDTGSAATGLPEGAHAVKTSSDFTFNFVEEKTEEEPAETVAEESPQQDPDIAPGEEEIDPFPEPDFTGESLDKAAADTAPELEEDNSLLYFGPDQAEDSQAHPEDDSHDTDPVDSALLQSGVFNPATSNEADPAADEDSAMEHKTQPETEIDTDEIEDTVDEESYAGPEISEQAEDSDGDFAMPDFSPLEDLEPDSATSAPVAAFSADDEQQDDVAEVGHLETNLDEESLWPDEEEMDHEDTGSLPDPSVSPRYLADETHDALQAFDDGITDMGLETPGQGGDDELSSIESDEAEGAADDANPLADFAPETDEAVTQDALEHDTDPESDSESAIESKPEPDFEDFDRTATDETESVFITSEEDEVDEAYQAMNVENDRAYHDSGDGDFPLPDEMEDFDQHENPDIDKLLQQAADGQADIDAKLAEAGIDEPKVGSPDDDSEDEPSLGPVPLQTDSGPTESPGLMNKVSDGIGAIADKLHFGRRSYHGLDTYETQEHQDTLLVRQLDHESHGSLFDFIPPGTQRVLLVLINVALIALLLFQIGKYFMDDLVQIRVLRPVLVAGCQVAGCNVPMASNPAAIEQLSSKMTVLDGENGGLRIAVTLINGDNNEQPFPALELNLTDRSGKIISRQIVKADQYRGKSAAYTLMQPGQAEDVKILLRTPAVRVDGFELRPVKLHWLDPR